MKRVEEPPEEKAWNGRVVSVASVN
jgi:hypothetical protein